MKSCRFTFFNLVSIPLILLISRGRLLGKIDASIGGLRIHLPAVFRGVLLFPLINLVIELLINVCLWLIIF